MTTAIHDVLFVGGGLANALAAWRLEQLRPELSWRLLEAGREFGGGQGTRTWSFHASDLGTAGAWATELASCRWPGHAVKFPRLERRIDGTYFSLRSNDLHAKLWPRLAAKSRFGRRVVAVDSTGAILEDGQRVGARLVIDARGFAARPPFPSGHQKFLGIDFLLAKPHGLTVPVLMDATVEQRDGFRFVYVLPWSANGVLIEDTYYSDEPELDEGAVADRIRRYADSQGWSIAHEGGRERGVLPLPFAGDDEPTWPAGVALAGVASGRFHPTTGYSFAEAVRFADELAVSREFSPARADELNAKSREIWRRGDFFRRLNNMFFRAAAPDRRWQVMEQFYGRDEDLIRRFYRGELRRLDQVRLLSGKPPVPLARGLAAFVERIRSPHV